MAVRSPCRNICELDPQWGLCRGCGRSVPEIARWLFYPPETREELLRVLRQRLAHLPGAYE
ncbi:MAG: DUF1289 domain-containing protein [Hyphomonadaceae bacterium]